MPDTMIPLWHRVPSMCAASKEAHLLPTNSLVRSGETQGQGSSDGFEMIIDYMVGIIEATVRADGDVRRHGLHPHRNED